MNKKKVKVALGMSGGVDSSVSAWLLKEQGYEVTGFFMKYWADPACKKRRENSCCDSESLKNARAVAKKLGIKFQAVGVQELFKKVVVDDFIKEYQNLQTPNPCVKCNKFIKFGWFLELAKEFGFDKVATGHYCRIEKDAQGVYHLLAGKDKTKDQSYFLYQLDQSQLAKVIFPVGELAKKEVMEIAKKQELMPKDQKESQEICFIQEKDYRDFLKKHIARGYFKDGNIVNKDGQIIGKHEGLINYTIGQRKGIRQDAVKNESREPLYVIGFNQKKNELVVGEEKDLLSKEVALQPLNWISEKAMKKAFEAEELTAKIRYRHLASRCVIKDNKQSGIKVIFDSPQRAVAPGQSLVFYHEDEVLGGGIIRNNA